MAVPLAQGWPIPSTHARTALLVLCDTDRTRHLPTGAEAEGDVPRDMKVDGKLGWRGSTIGMYASPSSTWMHSYRSQFVTATNALPEKRRFTSRVKPWVHYVPIQVTYTDLHDAMAFFRTRRARGQIAEVCSWEEVEPEFLEGGRYEWVLVLVSERAQMECGSVVTMWADGVVETAFARIAGVAWGSMDYGGRSILVGYVWRNGTVCLRSAPKLRVLEDDPDHRHPRSARGTRTVTAGTNISSTGNYGTYAVCALLIKVDTAPLLPFRKKGGKSHIHTHIDDYQTTLGGRWSSRKFSRLTSMSSLSESLNPLPTHTCRQRPANPRVQAVPGGEACTACRPNS
ncbi:hypothetical protein PAXINDRAFT_156994 [Paxillus involutus ATCC 200175]|uniref:Uncharacterized protein n=1 Tax=Paxillus involutus ATCC 200175 TaxID=664439 RepID=A0A0C9TP39_PAXIN|nr:hypothetical protein PAXINDRAFT_156994 [Paxillus involutus ATCC 200175]